MFKPSHFAAVVLFALFASVVSASRSARLQVDDSLRNYCFVLFTGRRSRLAG